jgi:curved DNA-binding protein CbpA
VADLASDEVVALAGILGDLDYYQLLHLEPDARTSDIKRAFHASSRTFHPDGNRHRDADVRKAIDQISKRITEAYSVLRNPRRRDAYDRHLAEGGSGVRMDLAEADAIASRQQTEARHGRTPLGRQYSSLAAENLAKGQFAAAVRNLQTALTFEPDSAFFKEQLEEARKKLDAEES